MINKKIKFKTKKTTKGFDIYINLIYKFLLKIKVTNEIDTNNILVFITFINYERIFKLNKKIIVILNQIENDFDFNDIREYNFETDFDKVWNLYQNNLYRLSININEIDYFLKFVDMDFFNDFNNSNIKFLDIKKYNHSNVSIEFSSKNKFSIFYAFLSKFKYNI